MVLHMLQDRPLNLHFVVTTRDPRDFDGQYPMLELGPLEHEEAASYVLRRFHSMDLQYA